MHKRHLFGNFCYYFLIYSNEKYRADREGISERKKPVRKAASVSSEKNPSKTSIGSNKFFFAVWPFFTFPYFLVFNKFCFFSAKAKALISKVANFEVMFGIGIGEPNTVFNEHNCNIIHCIKES